MIEMISDDQLIKNVPHHKLDHYDNWCANEDW